MALRRLQLLRVPDLAEQGLLRDLARTRTRLVVSTLLVTGSTVGLGLLGAHYVLELSRSVGLNLLIITGVMMAVLVAAYPQTLLAADLLIPGPWREQVLLGREPERPEDALTGTRSAEIFIAFLVLVTVNALALDALSGGFLDRYHNEAFFEVRLRSPIPDERHAALDDMLDPLHADEIASREGVRDAVVAALEDEDASVRRHAMWNVGVMGLDEARDVLMARLQTVGATADRAEAAIALGRLGGDDAREALEAALARAEEPALRVGLLRGLGLLASPRSRDALEAELDSENHEVLAHAYWALRELPSPLVRPLLLARRDDTTGTARCALLDTLKWVAHEDDTNWARRAFQTEPHDVACDPIVWEERDERTHTILYGDTIRVKLMKIVANAGRAHEQRAWFQRIVNDPAETWRVREVANEVLRALDG